MAADMDESYLDLSDFELSSVIQLQAVCRRWLAQRHLKQAQKEFEGLVRELDGPLFTVAWTGSSVLKPVVTRLSKRQKHLKETQDKNDPECDDQQLVKGENATVTSFTVTRTVSTCNHNNSNSLPLHTSAVSPLHPAERSNQEVQTDSEVVQASTHAEKQQVKADHVSSGIAPHETGQDGVLPTCEHSAHIQQTAPQSSIGHTEVALKAAKSHLSYSGDGTYFQPVLGPEHTKCEKSSEKHFHHDLEDINTNDNRNINNNSFSTLHDGREERAQDRFFPPETLEVTSIHEPQSIVSEVSSRATFYSLHGDQTSVWDSSSSMWREHHPGNDKAKADDHVLTGTKQLSRQSEESDGGMTELSTAELMKQRQNTAMELLWVQQTIISRKKYLKLKSQMEGAT